MGITLGIDFGTDTCCVYALVDGADTPELVPSRRGTSTTPSVVAFRPDGTIDIGHDAASRAATNAEHTVVGAKRLLGRKFYAGEVTWLREAFPAALTPASNGDLWLRVGQRTVSPQEIAGLLLGHLKELAEERYQTAVEGAVLAVPVCFDELERRALLEACQLAELPVIALCHEPTALARAFVAQTKQFKSRVAILDLGAGCLDVAIFETSIGSMRVTASSGDTLLGGLDLDRRLVELMNEAFLGREGIDLLNDPTARMRLFEVARRVRHELSLAPRSSSVELQAIADRAGVQLRLRHPGFAREVATKLFEPELDMLATHCGHVLDDLGLGTDDIEELVLAGGCMQDPVIRRTVSHLFRNKPRTLSDPEQLIARGAAYHAMARDRPGLIQVEEIASYTIGVKGRGGRMSPLIGRGQPIPCRTTRQLSSAGGASVAVEIFQGESEHVRENVYIGRIAVLAPEVEVALGLDEDGLLSAACVVDGRDEALEVQWAAGLGELGIAKILAREENRELAAAVTLPGTPNPATRATLVDLRADFGDAAEAFADVRRRVLDAAEERAQHEPSRSSRPPRRSRYPRQATIPPPGKTMQVGHEALIGTTLGGRYLIEDIIAEGGMGRVYRARHNVLNKVFAIKVLHPELANNEELSRRFVAEAQAASSIQSDHVVDISDFGRLEDGSGYFVMEYLTGQTLGALIAERGALPWKVIVDIAGQVCDALADAHERGIVHRDLKPDNITLTERRGRPYFCKVLDFGIAKCPTSDSRVKTLTGGLVGTPYYVPPEQIDGDSVDGRADLYSLGAVMYEMATGVPPFQAKTVLSLLVMHKTVDPEPVRSRAVASHVPEALDEAILRCLAKAPEDRFDSARELSDALRIIA